MCVDDGTGCFVPLAELRTTNDVRFYTDSVGGVAITDPDLLDCAIYLKIASLGKTCPGDSFGNHGAVLKLTPGGKWTFRVKGEDVADWLCRITGAGICGGSVLLGEPAAIRQ